MAYEMFTVGNQQTIIAANPLRRYYQFQAREAPPEGVTIFDARYRDRALKP
jgi:hypothetical protein